MAVDALAPYDPANIFARILRGEIPNRTVYEDAYALAFHDIAPLAPVHVLVIPKSPYVSLADFAAQASDQEIAGFWRAVGAVTRQMGLAPGGFRVLTNAGLNAGQEVPHMHVHVFAGAALGPMLSEA
jgi:histidine triad (HIT) family protein